MYTKHAEFKAGLVVLASLAAFLGFLFRATGSESPFAKHAVVYVRFEQGFVAPHVGDWVLMNGFKIGTVAAVDQREETRRGDRLTESDRARLKLKPGEDAVAREIYVLASVEMPPEQKIPRGTTAEISVSLTGQRTLALLPGLSTEDIRPEETRENPILATAAGDLTGIQRAVEELLRKVQGVAENANLALVDVRDVVKSVRGKIETIDITGIQGNVLEASKSLRATLETLRTRVEEIAEKVSDAGGNLRTMTADGAELVKAASADVKQILASIKTLSADLEALVARSAPKVDTLLDDVDRAAKAASTSLEEFQGLGTQVKGVVGDAGANLDRILARIAEAGHNLADMTEDLRSNPWKLANRPEDKEIAYENLRNAATNYVRASQALQETAQDLKALEGRADLGADERKRLVQAAVTRLQADLSRYEEAARFFTTMLQSSNVQAPR